MMQTADKSDSARVMVIGTPAETRAVTEDLGAILSRPPLMLEFDSPRAALDLLRKSVPDLIVARLLSLREIGLSTEDTVARLAKAAGEALLIALADVASVSTTLAAMGAGAHDCLPNPFPTGVLGSRVVDLARRHGKTNALAGKPVVNSEQPVLANALAEMQAAYQQMARLSGRPGIGGERKHPVLPMWQQEQRIIEDAIASFDGNVALAAAALEISPSTIYRRRQAWADASSQVA